jgi:hypothetical protein
MPIQRSLVILALAVAGCGASTETETPQATASGGDIALACWSIDDKECRGALAEASELLGPDHPPIVAASVGAFGCDALPCAIGLARGGSVSIELANGSGLHAWAVWTGPDGSLTFGDRTTGLPEPFRPESPRLTQPVVEFSLGHCGLGSPIDVDGSYWDPVGPVDSNAPDAINSSSGTFSLLSPVDAQFRSRTGFTVNLRRHDGAKNLFGCA